MAITKNIKINVDTTDVEDAEKKLKQMATASDTAESKADIRVDVDSTQIDTAKLGLDQMGTSLDTASSKALKTSSSLKKVGDNGGAIAVLDRLTGGLATQFRDAFEATKLFNFSLKGTRAALIATGVGAFVVLLGLVVAYWDDIKDAITGVNREIEKQGILIQDNIDLLDSELGLIDAQIKLGIQRGTNVDDLIKKQKELNAEKRKELILNIGNLNAELLQAQAAQERFDIQKFITGGRFTQTDERKAATKELETQLNEAKKLLAEFDAKVDLIENPPLTPTEREELEKVSDLDGGLNFEDTNTLDSKKLLNELLTEEDIKLQESQSLRDYKALKDKEIIANFEKKLREEVKDFSIGLASDTISIIGGLAKEGSDLQRGLAVAQATIDTYKGAVAAYAAGSATGGPAGVVLGPIAAGLAVAAGFANIKRILSVKDTETSVPSAGGSRGASTISSPSFNLVAGTQGNQIANTLQNQPPLQTFVVSTAVTSAQSLDRNSENNSTL